MIFNLNSVEPTLWNLAEAFAFTLKLKVRPTSYVSSRIICERVFMENEKDKEAN